MPAGEKKDASGLLPKQERLSSSADIRRILKTKQFHFSSSLLNLVAEESPATHSRLAVVCSSRLGNAVLRNKLKRRAKACFSKIKHQIAKKYDFVLIFRKSVDANILLSEMEKIAVKLNQ